MRWSVEEYFKSYSTDYKRPLEILHWDALERLKSFLKWPMSDSLSLESDKKTTVGKTLKHLTKLLDRLPIKKFRPIKKPRTVLERWKMKKWKRTATNGMTNPKKDKKEKKDPFQEREKKKKTGKEKDLF